MENCLLQSHLGEQRMPYFWYSHLWILILLGNLFWVMNPLNAQVPTDREWIEESLPGQASSAGDSLDIFLKVCDQACYTHPQWVVEWFTGLNKSGTVSSGTELGFMGAICSARAYTVMRKPDSAGVWIQSVLKAGPRSAGVYYWQACVETATRFLSERNTKEASLWAGKVLSSPLSGPEEKAEAYLVLASVLGFNGDYPGALETAGKGLGLIGNDMSGRLKARLLIFKGLTEIKTGKLAIALRHLLEARQAVLSLHDNALLFEIHSAIGTIFWQAGEHKNASSLFERSLGYYNQIAYPPPGIGDLYNNLGIVNLMLERYQDAESYFLQAIHHHKAEGSHHRIAAALNNMAELRIATGEHREADEYIQTALGMARQNKDTSMLASMLHTLAKVNKAKGDYQEASRVLKEAQSYAMTRKLGWVLSAIYEEQYLVAELSGDYRSAFESLKLYQAARDSVLDARLRLQVVETKMEINRDSGNSAAVAPQNSGMPVHAQNQNPFTRYLLAILTLVSGIMLISLIYAVYFQ